MKSTFSKQKVNLWKRGLAAAILLSSTIVQAGLYTWDDGQVDSHGGTSSGDLLALNHFDTGGAAVLINEIRVLWDPISQTVHPAVALYADPNGDGNPSDMIPLLIHPISIRSGIVILNNTAVQSYSIPETLVNGSFFVGAFLSDRESSFTPLIGVDLAHIGRNQSWILENSMAGFMNLQNPWETSTLRMPLDAFIPGNHMIEAQFVPVPEPSLLCFLSFSLLYAVRHSFCNSRRLESPVSPKNG